MATPPTAKAATLQCVRRARSSSHGIATMSEKAAHSALARKAAQNFARTGT